MTSRVSTSLVYIDVHLYYFKLKFALLKHKNVKACEGVHCVYSESNVHKKERVLQSDSIE